MSERTRLLQWRPGACGYSPNDIIYSVGLQCNEQPVSLRDVLEWLGYPEKCQGDSRVGQLAYFFSKSAPTFAIFDVKDGLVIEFGTVERYSPNSFRIGPDGKRILFNVLEEMVPFNATFLVTEASRGLAQEKPVNGGNDVNTE